MTVSILLSSNLGYSGPDGGPCEECEAGKFKSLTGSSPCLNCEAGTYSSQLAATSRDICADCTAGKYSTIEGANATESCKSCDAGKYSSAVGANASETCKDCEMGKYSSIEHRMNQYVQDVVPASSRIPQELPTGQHVRLVILGSTRKGWPRFVRTVRRVNSVR